MLDSCKHEHLKALGKDSRHSSCRSEGSVPQALGERRRLLPMSMSGLTILPRLQGTLRP